MGGILPLLEAFIAFALTMAALTTVVSALVGTWHKLTRARAYGLRMQMVYFFRNELKPAIERLAGPVAPADPRRAGVVSLAEPVTLDQWVVDLTKRGADPGVANGNFVNRLAQFLVDMTLLPQVVDFKTDAGGQAPATGDARIAMLRSGLTRSLWMETTADGAVTHRGGYIERYRRWRSLRFALDSLPTQEFKVRFAASAIGEALKKGIGETAFEAELARLTQRFEALGNAASESFRRKAHITSYVAAFLLAFGANVDTFNLLSRYMAPTGLAQQLVDAYATSGVLPEIRGDRAAAEKLLPKSATIDALRAQVDAALKDPALEKLNAEAVARLKAKVAELSAAGQEVRVAALDATSLIVGASQTFPVGWNLYPNCGSRSEDPRCLRLDRTVQPQPGLFAWTRSTGASVCNALSLGSVCSAIAAPFAELRAWRAIMIKTMTQDPAGFYRWFVGVLITGFLLGLGTPFWVQVINGALYARNLLRGPNSSGTGAPVDKTEEGATVAKAAAGAAAAPAVVAPPARRPALRILPS